MPEKSAQREPSTPSTRNRAPRLEDILEEREKLGSSQTLEIVTRKSGKPGSCAAQKQGKCKTYWRGKAVGGKRKMRSTIQKVLSNPQVTKFKILQEGLGTFWVTEKECFARLLFRKAEKANSKMYRPQNSWKQYSKTQKRCSWQKKSAIYARQMWFVPAKILKNPNTRG